MPTRIIGTPGDPPANPPTVIYVNAPPPAGTGGGVVGSCACSSLSVAWANGTDTEVVLTTDEALPAFAASGTICPGTTWNMTATSWTADDGGDAPTIRQFGDSAWALDGATAAGIFTVAPVATCGGQTFSTGPIYLTIVLGDYYPATGECVAPSEYTSLLALKAAGCIEVGYEGTGSGNYSEGVTDWFAFPLAFYANLSGTVSGAAGAKISFVGLAALFGGSDMAVRVTITDGSLTAGAYPFFVDNKNDLDDFPMTAGTSWEYTIANSEINSWVTGFGTGDGAGDVNPDYLQVRIEVKKA